MNRRDVAQALVEEFVASVLWFHPWVWFVRSRIRLAREQVVDVAAVRLTGRRTDYVRCLVELSGYDLGPNVSTLGTAMVRPRELRARIDAILQEAAMSRSRLIAATAALIGAVAVTSWIAILTVPLRAAPIASPMGASVSLERRPAEGVIAASSSSGIASANAPQSSPAPIRIDAALPTPRRVSGADPVYPQIAMAAGVRDVVVLEIRIDSTGRVSDDVRVLKPVPLLDEAAISAVKQWRYEPTQLNGVAVPVILAVSVNFKEPVADRGRARLRITLPDGGVSPEYETGLNDGIGVTLAKDGVGRFGFAASIDWSTTPSVVRVEIFDGGGITPVRLGVVEVPAGTGVVKSTTSPSFGLEIVRLDRPRSLRR